jgi:alkylation response protein AidB-like acyl-CoA dehydrogenase
MFIIDMDAPGVEVRPINQIDGRQRFNEVFFTDVHIPARNLIPPENDGWRLATAMLMYERFAIGGGQQGGSRTDSANELIAVARARSLASDPSTRQALARLYTAELCQSLLAQTTRAAVQAGKAPGPAGSAGKLARSEIARQVRSLSLQLLGAAAIAWDPEDPDGDRWSKDALASLSASIAGGTDEVQKNIIGERVLGLPREPAVDPDVPFSRLAVAH